MQSILFIFAQSIVNMKKLIIPILVAVFFINLSCDKGQQILRDNVQEIEEYLEDNNLTAERTDNDLFYIIEEEGNGEFPTSSTTVEVDYHGYFTDGVVFDSSIDRGESTEFSLNNVIRGWREGIPLFSKGGKGKLLIPSHLGYGEFGIPGIPGNTVLIFDIHLIDF